MVKVAINGFGRIGRNTLRAAIREGIFNEIDYVAINDPGLKPEDAARIFKYDSVMGKFDGTVEAYEEGIIDGILTTNLIYQTPNLLSKPYYINCDMSKYIALIIDTLNHDGSLSEILSPNERIQNVLQKYKNGETI